MGIRYPGVHPGNSHIARRACGDRREPAFDATVSSGDIGFGRPACAGGGRGRKINAFRAAICAAGVPQGINRASGVGSQSGLRAQIAGPANLFGALVATNEEPRKLMFVARKNRRPFAKTIELDGSMVAHEPKFLSENLIIFPKVGKGARYSFAFPRLHAALVQKIVQDLRVRVNSPIWPLDEPCVGAGEVASEESHVERSVSHD